METVSLKNLRVKFQSDIDVIAESLIDICKLKYSKEESNLSCPLMRWLDFRMRFIDPAPRPVIFSEEATRRTLSIEIQQPVKKFVGFSNAGKDLNLFQSKGIIKHNDTSSIKGARTDLLWADWGIWHFHLSDVMPKTGEYFAPRSDYIMFCIVGINAIAVIDIVQHPQGSGFADPNLLEIVYKNWPEHLERFQLKGILPPNEALSKDEIYALRSAGITTFVKLGNSTFMGPGMGYSTAKTSIRALQMKHRIRHVINALADLCLQENSQFQIAARKLTSLELEFSIEITVRGIVIYEKNSDMAFTMPRYSESEAHSDWHMLNEFMFPIWLQDEFIKQHGSKNLP